MARPRKPEGEKIEFDTVGLKADDWNYLSLYLPGGNPTERLREAIDALRRMRPAGPEGFGHTVTARPRQRLPYKALDAYAADHGMTRTEATAQLVKIALAEQNTSRPH